MDNLRLRHLPRWDVAVLLLKLRCVRWHGCLLATVFGSVMFLLTRGRHPRSGLYEQSGWIWWRTRSTCLVRTRRAYSWVEGLFTERKQCRLEHSLLVGPYFLFVRPKEAKQKSLVLGSISVQFNPGGSMSNVKNLYECWLWRSNQTNCRMARM